MNAPVSHSPRSPLPLGDLLAGLAILAGFALAFCFPAWTVDDAFINYRHAENLVLHGDLTWNAGEDPVEGCTGIALPLAVAAGIRLGLDPDRVTDAIGGASLILAALFLGFAVSATATTTGGGSSTRDSAPRVDPFAALAVVLFLVAPPTAIHWGSGLETTLFTAALTGAVALALAAVRILPAHPLDHAQPDRRRIALECALAPTLLVLGLVRPEGAAVGAILAGGLAVARTSEGRRATLGWLVRAALGFVIPGAIYFAWRWNHYGAPLPNTFYAKRSADWIEAGAARQLGRFAYDSFAAPGAALALILLLIRAGRSSGTPRAVPIQAVQPGELAPNPGPRGARILLATVAIAILVPFVQYLRSRPVMAYGYRFHAPYLTLVYLLVAVAARASWRRLNEAGPISRGRRRALAAGLAACLALHAGLAASGHRELRLYARSYRCILEDEHFRVADFLREVVPPGEAVVVYMDVGAIGYRSRLPIVDFGALNDETLARGGLSDAEKIDYYFARRPAAAVFTSRRPDRVDYLFEGADVPPASAILADPRFAEYRLERVYRTDRAPRPQRYFQFVFVRSDLPRPG